MAIVTFAKPTHGEGKYIRQPPGRYGHVQLVVERKGGAGLSFAWEVPAHLIPAQFEAAVRQGVSRLLEPDGPLQELGKQGLLVRVVGGSTHETDANETSYVLAAAAAFRDAVQQAIERNAA